MNSDLPALRHHLFNILSSWLLQAGSLLFALISVPLVTRRFGLEGLGVWLLVQQLVSHLQLLELGLASSLGRFLSRDHALNKADDYTKHTSSAIAILLFMGGSLVLLSVPIGQAFPHVFQLPTYLVSDAEWMLEIAIVATGLTLPLRSAIGVLSSQHRFALISSCDGLALIARVILIVVVCTMLEQHALIALSVAVFTPSLISSLVMFVIAHRSAPYVLFSLRTVGVRPTLELFDISLTAMLVTLAAVLLRQGGGMLAGFSQGIQSVTIIALPMMMVVNLGPFLGIANQLIAPIASQLDATKRVNDLRAVYLVAVRYTLTMGLFIYACMILVVPYLLPLWLGRASLDVYQVHTIYLIFLLIFGGYCLTIPALLARAVLVSVGKHRIAARGELICSIVGLAIGWLLMDTLDLGVTGMAWGIAAAYLFRAGGVLMYHLSLYFNITLHNLFREVWSLPLLTAVPLVFIFIPQVIGNQYLYTAVLFWFLALGVWIGLVFRLIMPERHRIKFCRLLRMKVLGRGVFNKVNQG